MKKGKLSQETIEEVARIAANAAIDALIKQEAKKRDTRLRNTKLLMKKYRMLKAHCKVQEDRIEREKELDDNDIFTSHELTIEVLMKYKRRTEKLLRHFELGFKAYTQQCEEESKKRRAHVANMMYIAQRKMSVSELADFWAVDERTIHRELEKAIEDMSVFLYGIDGIDVKNVS